MVSSFSAFWGLFHAVFLLLAGIGLLSTFLSLRLTLEGYSATVTGMVMSGYFVGLVAGSFISHRLIRRLGHVRAFAAFAACCSAAVMMHGLWVSPVFWGVLRVISGAAIMGLYMVIESWLSAAAQPAERGRVFSVYMVVTYLGLGLGQFLLMTAAVDRPDFFLIIGMLFSLSLVPVLFTRSDCAAMPERVACDLPAIIRKAPLGMGGCLVSGLLCSTICSLGPVFACQTGLSVEHISVSMGVVILSGMLFQYPVGVLSDRCDRRRVLGGLGLAVAFCTFLMVACPVRGTGMLLLSVVYGGLSFTVYPVAVAHSHDTFNPADIVGVSSALLLAYGVGGSVGPLLASLFMGPPFGLGPNGMFSFIMLSGGALGLAALGFRKSPARLEFDPPVAFFPARPSAPAVIPIDPLAEAVETDRAI